MAINVKELNASKFSGVFEGSIETAVNSDKLGGETSEQWQSKIDNIQTTSRATFRAPGWYRVAKFAYTSGTGVTGGLSNTTFLIIKQVHVDTNCESHILCINSVTNKQTITSISSNTAYTGNDRVFTKARYTVENDTAYLEVYYNLSVTNEALIELLSSRTAYDYKKWEAIELISTDETVEGVTIQTTYDIPANASPVTDLDLEGITNIRSMPDGTDLNDCIENGLYFFSDYATSFVNVPNENAHNGLMFVGSYTASAATNNERIFQLYFSPNLQTVYFRTCLGTETSWYDWKRISTGDEIEEIKSDIIDINLGVLNILESDLDSVATTYDISEAHTYIATIHPKTSSDGVYLMNGTSFSLIGMEYGNHNYGHQTIIGSNGIKKRYISSGTWSEWKTYVSTSDLTTALAGYLPLTGGALTGTSGTILELYGPDSNNTYIRYKGMSGLLGYLGFAGGDSPVFVKSDSETVCKLIHSGNYTDYTIPKNGGGTVSAGHSIPLCLANTADTNTNLQFTAKGSVMGYIGYYGANTPVVTDADGTSRHILLHAGNYTDYTIPKNGGGTIVASSGDTALRLQSKSNHSYINFINSTGTSLGYIGISSDNQPVFYDNSNKVILHAGNYSSYAFPLDGSKNITGHIRQVVSNGSASFRMNNDARDMELFIGTGGEFHLTDNTNTKNLIYSAKDGTTTFNGDLNGTATNAEYLKIIASNEINFKGNATATSIWFNYRNADTGTGSGGTAISQYSFGNRNGSTSGVTVYAETFAGKLTGNADSATTVYITQTNPSTGRVYNIPFINGASGNQSLLANDGIGYWTNEGTTSATGTGELKLGNNIASGTAGNKKGYIYMYGSSTGYTEIIPGNNTTSNITINLPSTAGTLALTSSSITGNAATATALTTSAGSATQPVYFSGGKPVACTYTLGKSVPSDAKFTDTVYTHPNSGVTAGTYRSVTVNAAGHVTAGSNPTLTIGQGGTGATSLVGITQMLCNSTNNSAPKYVIGLNESYSGNGYTSMQQLRNAMGLGNTTGALPVANGGTGATTAANARTNLGLGSAATYSATSSVTSGSSALVTSGAVYSGLDSKVSKRYDGTMYNDLTSKYVGGTSPTYYRIILPDSIVSLWTMISIELSLRQDYQSETGGKIFINAHHNNASIVWQINASTWGNLTTGVKVYGSDGKYLYIAGGATWGTLTIDKMVIGDSATSVDLSSTTIDIVTELPETYQTATMYYGLNSGNFSSYAAAASHTHTSVNGVTPEWTGSIAYADTGWIAAWSSDGTKLKALNKTSFAAASHTHNYAGSSSAGGAATTALACTGNAATATTASYLSVISSNEINFKGATSCTDIYFNFRNADTGASSGNTAITKYYFANKNGSTSGVTLVADNFSGTAATATTASNLSYFKNTSTSAVGLDDTTANAICYTSGTSAILGQSDGALYKQVYNASWVHEIYGDYRTGQIAVRGKNNGTWQSWRTILDSTNFTSHVTAAKIGAASSSHNQAASTITAGTFGGQVVAPASTSYTTNHMRNTVFTTTDPGDGASTSYANGSIIAVY